MEFITKNTGKSVKIIAASFKDAANLKKEAFKCLVQTDIADKLNIDNLKKIEIADVLNSLTNLIISLDTSVGFEKAVFECLKVCIYDDKFGITPQLFDDKPELREDYYEIVSKCCEVNLRPFFKSLVSELSTRLKGKDTDDPKSETVQTPN